MDNELLKAVQNVFDGTHVSCLCAHFKQRMFQNFCNFFFLHLTINTCKSLKHSVVGDNLET